MMPDLLDDSTAIGWFLGFIFTCIGWGLREMQRRTEVNKLNSEIISLQADYDEKCIAASKRYDGSIKTMNAEVRTMLGFVESQDWQNATASRESICQMFFEDVLPNYINYVRLESIECRGNAELTIELVEERIVPQLEQFRRILDVLNGSKLLDQITKQPVTPDYHTLVRVRHVLRGFPVFRSGRSRLDKQLGRAIRALTTDQKSKHR